VSRSFAFIESNTTGTGHLCLQRARQRGFRVLFLTSRPQLYPFLSAELVAPYVLNTTDVDEICKVLQAQTDVQGLMSTSEYFVEIAAQVASRLSLVGSDVEAVRTCRHKGRFVRTLEQAGLNVPKTFELASLSTLEQLIPQLTFPVVVKPVFGSGSVGVRLASNATELLRVGGRLLSERREERGLTTPPDILVQEYLSGEEYSVEVLSVRGHDSILGCTKKHLGPAPFFVETGHDFPAPLDSSTEREIRRAVSRALSAVGYRSGPSHVELRLGADGRPWFIEVNPRLAGGMIPRAIEMATGIDVLGALIDFFAGAAVELVPLYEHHAAIRFLVAGHSGTVEAFHTPTQEQHVDGVEAMFVPIKPVGTYVELRGDFRDRLAYIIATAHRAAQLERALAFLLAHSSVKIRAGPENAAREGGRIRRGLRPPVLDIVCQPFSPQQRSIQLDRLAAIDEAHLGMLVEADILSATQVAPILAEIAALRADRYCEIAEQQAPRGLYALYEQLLISRLGERVGGVAHTARSRNDINACLFKLEARDWLTGTFGSLWRLRATLLDKAAHTLDVMLPVYSQFQPGQPGTLAYYLWSLDIALQRDQQTLLHLLDDLQVCPMGAGGGAGTDFPIRPEVTARLLGFSASQRSALDAVASRDMALRLLSAWAVCGTTLSRLAQDLQIWTMADVGLFDLPDDLVGGSSLMPQKRNPYLLEIVKGKLVSLPTTLGFSLHAMQKTTFSNSVEVGTQAVCVCADAAETFSDSTELLCHMVDGLMQRGGAAERVACNGAVIATQVANDLVRDRKISFHEAHQLVGARITAALKAGGEPLQALGELTQRPLNDLRTATRALMYGGGPGVVAQQLHVSQAELRHDSESFFRRTYCWIEAEQRRASVVRSLIAEGNGGAHHD